MLKGEFEEPEEHIIARQLSRLKYDIENVVNLQPFFYLHDVMKLTLKVGKQNKTKGAVSTRYEIRNKVYKGNGLETPITFKTLTKSEGKQP